LPEQAIFVSRHPDYPTDVRTQGFDTPPRIIEVDLGSAFDISHGLGDEDEIESAWGLVQSLQLELLTLEAGAVRTAVEENISMLLERLDHVERTVEVSSAYPDGEVHDITLTVAIRPRSDFDDAPNPDDDYHEYLDETLFAYTGTGRTEGNAYYEVTSVDDLQPAIELGWGG
jgi:hypothetical protein